MSKKKIVLTISVILVMMIGLSTGGFMCVYSQVKEFDQVFMEGVYIEGVDIGGLTREEAKARVSKMAASKEAAKSIVLYGDGKEREIPYTDFKGEYNIDQVMDEAFLIGHQGNIIERFRKFTSQEVEKVELKLERSHKAERAAEIVKAYKEEFYIAPQDATMVRKDKKFIITPESAGQELDVAATAEKLNRVYSDEKEDQVPFVISLLEPKITSSYYNDVQVPVASFYTTYTNKDPSRNTNLKVGAEAINTTIEPGETFALSDYLGAVSADQGYKNAKVIVNGKLVDGIGGGICQVASTLYNSILLTDLKIVSRQNHSLPVGYIPLGRDATYASGVIDFKFENPTDHPAYVESYVENNRLYVNIFGHESLKPDHDLKFESVIMEVIPAPAPKYINDSTIAKGTEVVELAGLDGKKVNLYKYIYKNGKLVDKLLENKSYYRPRAGIIRVGTKEVPVLPVEPVEPEPEVEPPTEVIDDPGFMDLYEE